MSWLVVGYQTDEGECVTNGAKLSLDCDISGGDDGSEDSGGDEAKDDDPVDYVGPRYIVDDGDCYYFSWVYVDGAWDMTDPVYDARVFLLVREKPRCPWDTQDVDNAWRIFRSFPLTAPVPSFEPTEHGITGMDSWLSTPTPAFLNHSEPLPSGDEFQVRGRVIGLIVDWGDGWVTDHDVTAALPWPDGSVTHSYTRKTCTPEYRETHPSGQLCHPALEAYPVTATFRWYGEYRVGGGTWTPIGTLDLSTTTPYDIDDVVGVLIP